MSEIEIKNILDKKLKKTYKICVPYSSLDEKISKIISDVRKNYKLDGFRKGNVPESIIREKYQSSILAEEAEKLINESSKKIVNENNLKLALTPKVEIKTLEVGKNLECEVTFEIFPTITEIDLKKIKVIKREVEIGKNEIADFVQKVTKNYCDWEKQDAGYKSKIGDAVNIDYVGKIDKQAFEGGSAQNYQLELGSKSFIDNFEEQLVGKKAGSELVVKVKFPKEYHNAKYAGKSAEFDVKVNSILVAKLPILNDEFVKNNFGLENFSKLEEIAKTQLESSYKQGCKNLFKKELFDFFNKKYDFDLPEGLVEEQFQSLWTESKKELEKNPDKFKNDKEKAKEEEKIKEENKKIAERMIRNGIILSDLSEKNKITVSREDLMAEINKKAANFAGQEKLVAEYYQKNPSAIQGLKGQILEEKTIDFILETAAIETKKISIKDFEKLDL